MSLLPASLKWIGSIVKKKKWRNQFLRHSRAANSLISCRVWPKFQLIQAFMHILATCKNEDPIKNEGARVVTIFLISLQSVARFCQIWNPSKILWLCLLPARMKKIHSKMKALECSQHCSHYKSMGIFPDAQGQLTRLSEIRSG